MADEPKPIRKKTDRFWWSMEAEKNYILHIGTFCKSKDDRRESQEDREMKFLLNYKKAIPNRKAWGNMISKEIGEYVERLIKHKRAFDIADSFPCATIGPEEEDEDGTL